MWSQTAGAGWFVFKDVASTVLDEVWCVSKVLGLTELDIWLTLVSRSVSKTRELLHCLQLFAGSYLYNVELMFFTSLIVCCVLHHNANSLKMNNTDICVHCDRTTGPRGLLKV